ncbi:hypothetical protein ABZ412_23595 [Nocardia sp. NPDC005746]|uniref:hypothetical protein n=1 Tax=Nocardia sp. NPDC005746 TaxID=3157062 RepID=UPI0033FBE369
MGFREWKQAVSNGDSDRAIAARMGTNQMRVARHLSGDSPVAETVIAFSRTYGVSPIEGLIAAGFLTRDDVLRASLVEALREATGAELAAEVTRRMADPEPDAVEDRSTTTRRERLGHGSPED